MQPFKLPPVNVLSYNVYALEELITYCSNTCSLIILRVRDVSIFVWRIQISCLLYKKLNDYGYVNIKVWMWLYVDLLPGLSSSRGDQQKSTCNATFNTEWIAYAILITYQTELIFIFGPFTLICHQISGPWELVRPVRPWHDYFWQLNFIK